MPDVLRRMTLVICPNPCEAPMPQTVVPWAEALAFLQPLEALAEAGMAFQLVETPGQMACIVADAPVEPAKAATSPRPCRAAAKA